MTTRVRRLPAWQTLVRAFRRGDSIDALRRRYRVSYGRVEGVLRRHLFLAGKR